MPRFLSWLFGTTAITRRAAPGIRLGLESLDRRDVPSVTPAPQPVALGGAAVVKSEAPISELQYLKLQEAMQREGRLLLMFSNIMKTKNDDAAGATDNLR